MVALLNINLRELYFFFVNTELSQLTFKRNAKQVLLYFHYLFINLGEFDIYYVFLAILRNGCYI